MEYSIRNAELADLKRIEEIYQYARDFMEKNGNPKQWGKTEPPVDVLIQDIERRHLFVVEALDQIHGVFYFYVGEDPTYGYIEGKWCSDAPYGTIHRIAGDGSGGILKTAVAFAKTKINHLRIDTHEDNHIMQRAILRQGFHRCGIIYVADGTPRIAYEL